MATDSTHTYVCPNAEITSLVATDDRETAAQYIERGYTLFAVPQMFGAESGQIVLYLEHEADRKADGMSILEGYERESRNHISGGASSFGQMNVSH